MKVFLMGALCAALSALLLPAQTGKKKPPVKPVPKAAAAAVSPDTVSLERIQVKGNRVLTSAQIEAVAAVPLKKPLSKADFDAARDRLLETGYFESVAFQYGPIGSSATRYESTFEVVEVSLIYPVQFENLPVAANEIEQDLKTHNVFYGPKVPGTQQVLGYYARQIEQFLAARNHPERVIGELSPQGNDNFKVLFRSAEPLPPIAHVTFSGMQAISAITLQNAMNNVAFGAPFTRDGVRQLLESQIRPLYEAKGLIRVTFPMFTTEPAPKVKGVIVHVIVDEGPVYNLSKISLEGADPDYMDYVKIKPGGPVNFDQINESVETVKLRMKRNGYLDAQAKLERKVDDKAHTVEVVLQMAPGPQYLMGKLTIVGLDLNSEPVIRKLWITEEGKPFNALYPDYFLKRIREDGLFDGLGSTKSAVSVDEKTLVVDVTLTFGGGARQRLVNTKPL